MVNETLPKLAMVDPGVIGDPAEAEAFHPEVQEAAGRRNDADVKIEDIQGGS